MALEQFFGRIVDLVRRTDGDELTVAAGIAETVLHIGDTADFDETGGLVEVNGDRYTYSGVDPDAATITLDTGLLVAAAVGDRVDVVDEELDQVVVEYVAHVLLEDQDPGDQPIEVTVNHGLVNYLSESVRGGSTESVTLMRDGDDDMVVWQVDGKLVVDIALEQVQTDLNAELTALNAELDELNTVTLPQLQADLDANEAQITTLNTVTLPGLQSDLDANEAQITTLNTVTLPGLQSDLDANEAQVATLNGLFPITTTSISDGAITTPKMTANSINGDRITANTLNASKIVAGSITTDRMTANSIAGDRITANTLDASKIVAGSISTDRMTANSINGDRITANTLNADKIVAGSISTDRMTANTINGDRILTNSLHADKIVANTITAGKLAANAIDGKAINGGYFATTYDGIGGTGWVLHNAGLTGPSFAAQIANSGAAAFTKVTVTGGLGTSSIAGGLAVSGGVDISSGGLDVTGGGINVTSGVSGFYDGCSISGGLTVNSGGILAGGQIEFNSLEGSGGSSFVMVGNDGVLSRGAASSMRYKENVKPLDTRVAEALLQVDTITWQYKDRKTHGDRRYAGVPAEQLHDLGLDAFVDYDDQGRPDQVRYWELTAPLIQLCQSQQAQINDLAARLEAAGL